MAELWELDWNRLPLGLAVNTREMGGYPTKDGGRTNYHRFLRSGVLYAATDKECNFLYNYGVRCMIDLRGHQEFEGEPPVHIAPDVPVHHIPLYEFNIADLDNVDLNNLYDAGDPTITDVYYQILMLGKESVAQVFKTMAAAPDGCIMFYCTVGKDRTGVIAFLLLMLAGADMYDCIANYVPSRTQLMRYDVVRDMMNDTNLSEHRRGHIESAYESGEYLYRLIEDKLGGIENYLISAGVTAEELEAVRQRLVG